MTSASKSASQDDDSHLFTRTLVSSHIVIEGATFALSFIAHLEDGYQLHAKCWPHTGKLLPLKKRLKPPHSIDGYCQLHMHSPDGEVLRYFSIWKM